MSFDRPNVLSKMFLIPFLCIISSGVLSAAIMSCDTDGDCPTNHYCYTMTNVCAECISNFCSRFHREDSSWMKCHTEPSDCGTCLPGYEEEYFSDGTTRSSCILSNLPTPSQAWGYQNSNEGLPSIYFLGYPIFFSMAILLGIFMYKTVRRPALQIIRPDETELRPINNTCNQEPLNDSDDYEPSAPSPPGYSRLDPFRVNGINNSYNMCGNESETSASCEHKIELKEPVNCQLLQTAVFKRPNYEEEEAENLSNIENNEDEEDPNSHEDLYHDESTQLSTWTPGPSQVETENTSRADTETAKAENTSHSNTETAKRPSTELGSEEDDEDEQNPKRVCNNENEGDDESPSTRLLRNFFRSTFLRQNQNTTANNNVQNKNPESPTKDK